MSMVITKGGVLDTLQDEGRHGYAHWGINPGGCMDRFASAAGNMLVGNRSDHAVLEMHFPAPGLRFTTDALLAITGGEFGAVANGVSIPTWKPIAIKAGTTISFRRRSWGMRTYLAVSGGFDTRPWLNSKSTNVKAGVGGLDGRALSTGDEIPLCPPPFVLRNAHPIEVLPWRIGHHQYYDGNVLHFVVGPEWSWLNEATRSAFEEIDFTVDVSSDRMAYQLKHAPLVLDSREEMLSAPVDFGTLQCLPGGKVLILMADCQTTGGYPRIGHIASADLPRLAQWAPFTSFRLKTISVEDAEKMLLSRAVRLQLLERECIHKLKTRYASY